jgi:hypothetical protein
MKLLTTFNSLHDAEELAAWLEKNHINTTLLGRNTFQAQVYVPSVLHLYVLDAGQLGSARKLMHEYESNFCAPTPRVDLWSKLVAKKLDKIFIVLVTAASALLVIWMISSVT